MYIFIKCVSFYKVVFINLLIPYFLAKKTVKFISLKTANSI